MDWDEWRGSLDGRPVFWTKHLLCFWDCHMDLHKMVAADDKGCFHTHPAHAIRIILRGGYVEELEDGTLKTWTPGSIGWVRPSHCHRIYRLYNWEWSYSLWIRFRKVAKVELRGDGWQKQIHAPVR